MATNAVTAGVARRCDKGWGAFATPTLSPAQKSTVKNRSLLIRNLDLTFNS